MSSIAQICTKETLIRSSYCSDTYRCRLQLSENETGQYDVVHISIPFTKEKESALLRQYSELNESTLREYYSAFEHNVYHGWKIEDRIRNMKEAELDEIIDYRIRTFVEDKNNGRGKDIYAVYPVKEVLTDEMISVKGTSTHTILNMTKCLVNMAETLKRFGFNAGHFEIQDLMVCRGKGSLRLTVRGLGAFTFTQNEDPEEMPFLLPQHKKSTHPSIMNASVSPSYYTDIYSSAILLSNMLMGRSWMTEPVRDGKLRFASETFGKELKKVTEADPESFDSIGEFVKAIDTEIAETEDTEIHFNVSSLGLPEYSPGITPADEYSAQNMEEYDDDDYYYHEQPQANTTQTALIAVIILMIFATGCFALTHFILPELRSGLIVQERDAEPATQMVVSMFSSHSGLYVRNGAVVDNEGKENSVGYELDEEGNIIKRTIFTGKDEEGNLKEQTEIQIIYPADKVSPFIPVSRISIQQSSSVYVTQKTLEDHALSDRVISLLDYPFIFSDTGDEIMEIAIPDYIAQEQNIPSDALLLVYTGTRSDPGTGVYALISEGTSGNEEIRYYCRKALYEDGAYTDISREEYEKAELCSKVKDELGTAHISYFDCMYTVTAAPETAICRDICADVPENREIYLYDEFGNEVKNIRLNDTDNDGTITVHLKANAQEVQNDSYGEMILTVTSADNAVTQKIRIKGNVPSETGNKIKVPDPTPLPPVSQEPTVQITPPPQTAPVQSYSGTGYSSSGYDNNSETYVLGPFGIEPSVLYLSSGCTDRIYTAGDDGGYISVYSTDPAVAVAAVSNDMDGSYTVRAESVGECDIVFESVNGSARCHVYVR